MTYIYRDFTSYHEPKTYALEYNENNFKNSLKEELGRLFLLSFGVFLFILFFQPFPLGMLDYNNRLIFVTGFGLIEFLLACLVLVVIPLLLPKWFAVGEWESGPPFLLGLILITLTSTAFTFYVRYVGNVPLTFYIVFKVILVCLLPILSLVFLYKNKSLEHVISLLKEQNNILKQKLNEQEVKADEEQIEISSTNKSEKVTIRNKNIIAVKSADNYVEIFYLFEDSVEKKLMRSTLKNILVQLSDSPDFIRCHRTCLVNTTHIIKLSRNYSGYYLNMNHLEENVPVSRQYLEQVRASISVHA
jgi:hypothetical protein